MRSNFWVLTLVTVFYAKNFTNPNFELSNKGQPIKPDTTVLSDPLPNDSSLITEFYNWLTFSINASRPKS